MIAVSFPPGILPMHSQIPAAGLEPRTRRGCWSLLFLFLHLSGPPSHAVCNRVGHSPARILPLAAPGFLSGIGDRRRFPSVHLFMFFLRFPRQRRDTTTFAIARPFMACAPIPDFIIFPMSSSASVLKVLRHASPIQEGEESLFLIPPFAYADLFSFPSVSVPVNLSRVS